MSEDINKIKQANQLFEDIIKLTSGEEKSTPYLDEFMEKDRDVIDNLVCRLKDKERVDLFMKRVKQLESETCINRIKNKLKKRKLSLRRRNFLIVSLSAASALLAISFLLYQPEQSIDTPTIVVAQNDQTSILPILVTETGEKILLDSTVKNFEYESYSATHNIRSLNYKPAPSDTTCQVRYNELITPAMCTYNLNLSDGSEVILNAGSYIRFPVNFVGNSREVELKGEAYFKIEKSDNPFIVKVNGSYVKVFGTEFNVNARSSQIVKTVLIKGVVGVGVKDNEPIILDLNQMAEVDISTNKCNVSSVSPSEYIGWISDVFRFKDVELKIALKEIESWYGVTMTNFNFDLGKKVTFSVSRQESIEDVFEVIEYAIDSKIMFNKNQNSYELK